MAAPRFPLVGAAARAATAAFLDDPPFAGGHFGPRLGLEPLADGEWLPFAITACEQLRKQRLYARIGAGVYGTLQASAPVDRAGRLTLAAVTAARPEPPPLPIENSSPTLFAAAQRVPDDLCLLWQPAPGRPYKLLAASLSSPSYWRLQDKLGGSLAALHAPVRGMEPTLLQRMNRVFERLPAQRSFLRRNWFVHASAERYQPVPEPEAYVGTTVVVPAHEWFLRSERQTLRRLAQDLILFTVRVDLHPLTALAQHPRAWAAFEAALRSLEGETLAAFGGAAKRAIVQQSLRQLAG